MSSLSSTQRIAVSGIGRWIAGFMLVSSLCFGFFERPSCGQEQPLPVRLLIAYGSYKDRGKYPTITFYQHDGLGAGQVVGTIPPENLRSDSHPTLSHDGRFCGFTSEIENATSRILLWDLPGKELVELPVVNDSPNSQQHAALSGDGRTLAFAAWNRPGSSNRWDIVTFDIARGQQQLTPWNLPASDERMPALSGNGGLLAYVTNATETGSTDICLWDQMAGKEIPLPHLNTLSREVEPTLSADGRLMAFVSDRPGGSGARDIYLYDRTSENMIALPGLNSVAHEQMPSLSPDGRFLAFISERRAGAGERDVFIYDRSTSRLLETPGLNSPREEIDPCIIVLPPAPSP